MELSATILVRAAEAEVRSLVRDPALWRLWVPAVVASERFVEPEGEVELRWTGPRPVRMRLAVQTTGTGARWSLVEGEVSTAGAVEVITTPDGAAVRWSVRLDLPLVVPGALLRELRQDLLPRLTAALERAASVRAPHEAHIAAADA